MPDLKNLAQQAKVKHRETKAFLNKLKNKPPRELDQLTLDVHESVFNETNCLDCGNCCRTTGPLLLPKDIERLAKYLRMKPGAFMTQYLREDEDKDWVFKSMPCPFLGEDNYCSVYEHRPKACREFPHTDRKKLYQINNLTLKNVEICPAAFQIVEKLKTELKFKN